MTLKIHDLQFEYDSCPIFKNLSFSLQPKQLLHIKGRNGRGKTTLLKLLSGMLMPLAGRIDYCDQWIDEDLASFQQHIIYIGHKPGHSGLMSVRQNLMAVIEPEYMALMEATLKEIGLWHKSDVPCGLLSAGERRKVALAGLALRQAKIWLLDEPLTALDAQAIEWFCHLSENFLSQGGMIILSSHQALPHGNWALVELAL